MITLFRAVAEVEFNPLDKTVARYFAFVDMEVVTTVPEFDGICEIGFRLLDDKGKDVIFPPSLQLPNVFYSLVKPPAGVPWDKFACATHKKTLSDVQSSPGISAVLKRFAEWLLQCETALGIVDPESRPVKVTISGHNIKTSDLTWLYAVSNRHGTVMGCHFPRVSTATGTPS